MMRSKESNSSFSEEQTGEMDNEAGGFSSISNNWRPILLLFLVVLLPLLVYHNSTYTSVWSLRMKNQPPTQTSPEIAPSSTIPAAHQDPSFAVAPTTTPGTENHTLQNWRNVSSASKTSNSLNQTIANTTRTSSPSTAKPGNHTMPSCVKNSNTENILLDGLVPIGFDKTSCLSRYESHIYRKPTPHKPSSYLVSKLRSYERLHSRCGPNSRQYNKTLRKLLRLKHISSSTECNYIVWLPANGLGNRMLSLAATYLYAILTNRVLLVAFESEMSDVFCEPFLDSTWKLPHNFPNRHRFDHLPRYASLVKDIIGMNKSTTSANNMVNNPPFLYVKLQHEREEHERYFHCDEGQRILKSVPFLILMSDQYFAPSLFMIPSFMGEINRMFPEKDTVFHHLGRYLFNPSNDAWGQIIQFYMDNLSKADKKVGIQVRVFTAKETPSKTITEQILACTLKNDVLPKVDEMRNDISSKNESSKTKAVLVTSLFKEYSENLRLFYKTGKTRTGEVVRVYQPSHEEVQRFNNNTHYVKALAEIYLLSLCDDLVTSGQSTFGYVAQGLGALKPWILRKTVGNRFGDPPCKRALSMEPCFHYPPGYDCERRIKVEHISSVFPHMRRCEDVGTGVKLVSEP